MGVQQLTARPSRGSFGVLETLSPEMARDFGEAFNLDRNGTETGLNSPRITKNALETAARVRTPLVRVKPMGVPQLTALPARVSCGILETLSPEMARDLGNAFCLARIGTQMVTKAPRKPGVAAREALRFASRIAAFLLVVVVAVSLTVTAMYLVPFR